MSLALKTALNEYLSPFSFLSVQDPIRAFRTSQLFLSLGYCPQQNDLQAIVRIFIANTATSSTAVVAVADVTVFETVKQGANDVRLVGGLAVGLESLDYVIPVISYR